MKRVRILRYPTVLCENFCPFTFITNQIEEKNKEILPASAMLKIFRTGLQVCTGGMPSTRIAKQQPSINVSKTIMVSRRSAFWSLIS